MTWTWKHLASRKYAALLAVIAILTVSGYLLHRMLGEIDRNTAYLSDQISILQDRHNAIISELKKEKERNSAFSSQIGEIMGTISKLDKLSQTDKELLQKYSKVYFLNENYVPEDLIDVPPDYIAQAGKPLQIHAKAYPYLQEMIVAAKRDDIDLKIISAYRSFGEQSALKNAYTVTYGSGANKFSADQGYSEHQLGTALDFSTAELGIDFTSFKSDPAYQWMRDNAYKYGFILSYPDGNSYYQFEPWHWRFVGKSLARRLYEEKENFYDLEQRTIDNYLINIFD